MTDASAAPAANPTSADITAPGAADGLPLWTCPFCALLCDSFSVRPASGGGALELVGSDCPKARKALSWFPAATVTGRADAAHNAGATVDGAPADLASAVAAAARILAASRQPLFGGLVTDVAGARALYRLACRTGAISDHAAGDALMRSTRALQDKGAFTTTLAEIASRADLIVCVGGVPTDNYPEFFRRAGIGMVAQASGDVDRHVVVLGGDPPPPALTGAAHTTVEHVALDVAPGTASNSAPGGAPGSDLYNTVAALSACVARRTVRDLSPAVAALAARLAGARYAVLTWETGKLPAHGALIVEALNRVVSSLNRSGRAAAFALGGSDGAASVNQTLTWMSGLPLRSRAGPTGLEHQPITYAASRLLAGDAVDSLLWIASFGPEPAVPGHVSRADGTADAMPSSALPTVVLGHPAARRPAQGVFIPVATPGIGSDGHLFRVDSSSVLLPLHKVLDQGLPTVAEVLGRIGQAMGAAPTSTLEAA